MFRAYPLFIFCSLFVLMVGCTTAPPTHIPVPSQVPPALSSSEAIIVASQNEILADVEKSNVTMYTGGGLIPALIDVAIESSRSDTTEEMIVPIREALADYDVGARMKQALAPGLQTISWLHVKHVDTHYDKHPDVAAHLLPQGSTDALILINTSYKLTSDFSALSTNAEINVYPRSNELKRLTPPQEGMEDSLVPFYKNTVSRWYPLPSNPSDQDLAVGKWTRDQGKLIKEAMDQNIEGICKELLAGLRNSYTER